MPSGTITADGVMTTYITKWSGNDWRARLHLSGTFGGGTVTVSFQRDGGSGFLDVTDGGVFTTASDDVINWPHKTTMRLTLAGATAPSLDFDLT